MLSVTTIGLATSFALALPYSCSTIAKANSRAVPGPLLVISLPSTTTRCSAALQTKAWSALYYLIIQQDVLIPLYLLSDNLSTKAGCAVAFFPARSPCDSSTTAGAAHMAAYDLSESFCCCSKWIRTSDFRSASDPGAPPCTPEVSQFAEMGRGICPWLDLQPGKGQRLEVAITGKPQKHRVKPGSALVR